MDKLVKKDTKVGENFLENKVDTVDFGKELLGQIVSLYFFAENKDGLELREMCNRGQVQEIF